MKKEKGLLILSSKEHPGCMSIYDVIKLNTKYGAAKLNYSPVQGTWTKPGQLSCEIVNHGDGYMMTFYDINKKVRKKVDIDYSEAQEMRALLKLVDDSTGTYNYYKKG